MGADTSLEIQYRRVVELSEYSRNSRTHSPEQIAQLAHAISEFGFTNPVLIDSDGTIIAGHGRLMAARKLGMDEVPTIELSHLDEAQRRAYVIADNKLAEQAGWDEELLALELGELKTDFDFNLSATGFSEEELSSMLAEQLSDDATTVEDEPPEPEVDLVSERGDIWLLGDHRVMCGDSCCQADMDALCDGSLVDMVWTDPPYNVNYESADGKKIENDHMSDDRFHQFLLDLFTCAFAVTREGGGIYVAHSDSEGANFRGALVRGGWLLKQCLVWVKNQMVLGRQDYQWQHEPILYGWKPGAAHRWFGEFNKRTVIDDEPDLTNMDKTELVRYARELRNAMNTSIIREDKPQKSADHPTMKPIALVAHMVRNSSLPGDSVLDVCGGSGTTLMACEQIGRVARLMELDPKYCDVIVRRWQNYTGRSAVLAGDETPFDTVAERRLQAKVA